MKQKLKKLWNFFTTYEKIWFISITVLAFVFAFFFRKKMWAASTARSSWRCTCWISC